MAIHDIDEPSLQNRLHAEGGKAAVFFFTPLCGTCKIGERMLEIAEAAGISVPVYKLNINYAPRLREHWQIASVPCLVLLDNGRPLQKEYAMKAVDHIYLMLK
ncbi:thioredoxin family protein [Paenibacillus alkaliterrae]|uniref:thioredoxin family protein n=1 Tax=Paenibacillus alkaliterrae TaxID=320909 RepID=UPI001F4896AA|nr:thioredoxin family protein [Paenibacillus alkaliterrae]MCF2941663.1 thioredoxin family protein [Paenibacillus alkaliterrae]